VMALYVLVFLGTTPIGASLAGWWGERFGVPSSIWVAGLICFVTSVGALLWQLRSSGERLSLTVRPRPRLTLVRPDSDEDESQPVATRPVGEPAAAQPAAERAAQAAA
ncbi:MAG: hypothetical protein QOC94_1840, partial [Actinoplanes sp.]|nr:hypothetical protein [Actinoplanes sp.]